MVRAMSKTTAALSWTLLWAILVIAGLTLRPLLPIDETRYASVAWEMWLHGDYLVPHLNGETYSHKPPLLFWLMNASWALFGINDWTHRLIAPLFGLASLFLTSRIAQRLWSDSQAAVAAPLLLIAGIFWATFSTLTMFDMMVATWTLAGMLGLIEAWRGRAVLGWVLFALAIGLGVLSKGPVILVFLLPAALAAPYWTKGAKPGGTWGRWYLNILLATLGGAAIALAWAIPAGISGGEAYRNAIFWGQSAGRMVDSFAHKKPLLWYFAILPPMLLPWLLWPSFLRALWRGLTSLRKRAGAAPDPGARLLSLWIGVPFVIFSAFSGKAPHYLLPFLPAIAIAAAIGIERLPGGPRALRQALPLAVFGVLIVVTVHLAANARLKEAYDLRPFAEKLAGFEREGYMIAHYGNYHAQFQFLGRLPHPIKEIGDGDMAWLRQHPKAKVVAYRYALPDGVTPDYVQKFRGRLAVIWDGKDVLANQSIAQRDERPSNDDGDD
jgi:4-amino-4-deoxy-L-arabinose transferase-like glycosyltransferase